MVNQQAIKVSLSQKLFNKASYIKLSGKSSDLTGACETTVSKLANYLSLASVSTI